jgi:ubiquinol-cytochrome c reductase cytochrome b subunit
VVHVALFRRHGVTPGWRQRDEELDAATVPFWPEQLTRDFAAMAVVLGVLVAWVARSHGASLEAPADPASSYDARPEWYFLPLYQLLKYFPGRLELVAALGTPLVAGGLLFSLPLLDRGAARAPLARMRYVSVVLALLVGFVALAGLAELADRHNAGYAKFRVRAAAQAERARELARLGVPPAGGTAVYENDPTARGRRLYSERCAGCHLYEGEGERKAPDLDGWSSRAWIRAFLQAPQHERFYGATKIHGMKPVKATGEDLDALVEWVFALGGSDGVDAQKAARGREVFDASSCDGCHEVDGNTGGDGTPNLGDRATAAWVKAFLADPGEDRFFGRANEMPKFRGKLSDADLDALTRFLRAERAR